MVSRYAGFRDEFRSPTFPRFFFEIWGGQEEEVKILRTISAHILQTGKEILTVISTIFSPLFPGSGGYSSHGCTCSAVYDKRKVHGFVLYESVCLAVLTQGFRWWESECTDPSVSDTLSRQNGQLHSIARKICVNDKVVWNIDKLLLLYTTTSSLTALAGITTSFSYLYISPIRAQSSTFKQHPHFLPGEIIYNLVVSLLLQSPTTIIQSSHF
ncbi:hypothetical protein ABKN59_001987 [Abortiporus biennis]